jgi:hypothetical protein
MWASTNIFMTTGSWLICGLVQLLQLTTWPVLKEAIPEVCVKVSSLQANLHSEAVCVYRCYTCVMKYITEFLLLLVQHIYDGSSNQSNCNQNLQLYQVCYEHWYMSNFPKRVHSEDIKYTKMSIVHQWSIYHYTVVSTLVSVLMRQSYGFIDRLELFSWATKECFVNILWLENW